MDALAVLDAAKQPSVGRLPVEEFRALADAFDEKVQQNREAQERKAVALNQMVEVARVQFLEAARPILGALMAESGAGVILERSSVFLSANATDITDEAIQRIDAVIGEGRDLPLPDPR